MYIYNIYIYIGFVQSGQLFYIAPHNFYVFRFSIDINVDHWSATNSVSRFFELI